ncbi:DDB1- and CUL4-associated factor 10-like [Amphibalanus amphitrite]|uniref:DDB1- and CUL4-associated factor 10-like n=1 Tax=Amphibalanus amphitrite TaxID=1232801 RepID=UPI001C917F5E|nr:DDB1- and CUL4-associated factor 10-like [Amphibalanus amphitrite]
MPKFPRATGRVTLYPYDRQYGWRPTLGDQDAISSRLYSRVAPVATYEDFKGSGGAVFNLEFSKDGKVLVAACERRCVLLFDTLTRRNVHTVEEAHQGYVNCVKFLDCRMFASCSDDKTVAIWDVRNLRQKVHCLEAHSNWVKNIEYLPHKSLLVTSGFDGSIYTWNLNNVGGSEQRTQNTRVLHTNGLMRTSLTPDFSKLVICTNNGYLMVVHDVDFDTMQEDLRGFKPSLYKLMQISKTPFPAAARYTHLFDTSRRRNRIEFITDFPEGNEAEMIASLAMHPLGWCVASRNTSSEEASEWTCVHDIQDERLRPGDEDADPDSSGDPPEPELPPPPPPPPPEQLADDERSRRPAASSPDPLRELQDISQSTGSLFTIRVNGRRPDGEAEPEEPGAGDTARRRPLMQIRFNATLRHGAGEPSLIHELAGRSIELRAPSADVVEALEIIREHRRRQRALERGESPDVGGDAQGPFIIRAGPSRHGGGADSVFLIGSQARARERYRQVDLSHQIAQNRPRLTRYIEEPNLRLTHGFIKELCFSADGRLLCSPFGHGVRLLAFSETGQELSTCWAPPARPLHELAATSSHKRAVVTAKFSPCECLLVTGCLGGSVVWHQPRLV